MTRNKPIPRFRTEQEEQQLMKLFLSERLEAERRRGRDPAAWPA